MGKLKSAPPGAPSPDPDFGLVERLPGFLDLDAFQLFCCIGRYAAGRKLAVLEIGVFCGRSLVGLGLAFRESAEKIVGIDPFFEDFRESPALQEEGEYLARVAQNLGPGERLRRLNDVIAATSYAMPGLPERFVVRRITQEEFFAGRTPDSERFDVAHIDGEHTYSAVYDFLSAAPDLLNRRSIVIVDDFLNPGFPGISEAVHTHPTYRAHLVPTIYAFNKALFLYEPDAEEAENFTSFLAAEYRRLGRLVRPLADGSVVIQ